MFVLILGGACLWPMSLRPQGLNEGSQLRQTSQFVSPMAHTSKHDKKG